MAPTPPETSVVVLTEKHAASIAQLKENMRDVLTNPAWDDLWLLRYCLSHHTVVRAEEAARKTIKWRTEKAEMLQAAQLGRDPPHHDRLGKYAVADIHKQSKNDEPVYIIRAGLSNPDAAMHEVTHEECVDWLLYHRELAYIKCNAATRRTGRLVKLIVINDLNFLSIGNMNKKLLQANLAAGKLSNEYFPQLLGKAIIVNPPKVFGMLFATVKPLIPKKTLEKVKICPGRTLKDTADKCPFVSATFDMDNLPSFLGGRCTCHEKGGCINGVANDQRAPNLEVDADGMCQKTIARLSKHQLFLEVDAGAKVEYVFEIETAMGVGVEFGASVREQGTESGIVAPKKFKAEAGQVKGEFICPKAGTCIVTFENTAKLCSAAVRYSVGAAAVEGATEPDDSASLAAASNLGDDPALDRHSDPEASGSSRTRELPAATSLDDDEYHECEDDEQFLAPAANGTSK